MNHILDGSFNGGRETEMYRGWVFPDLFPNQPQPVLSNWRTEDLAVYCGGEFFR